MGNRIFIDLNIVIDVVDSNRQRHESSKAVLRKAIKEDFEMLVRGKLNILFNDSIPMPQGFYTNFPDPIEYTPIKGGGTINLWLERFIFTNDPRNSMIFVYKRVNEALEEEEIRRQ